MKMTRIQINKSAQSAADLDNYRSAIDRLGTNSPIALNNNKNIPILRGLYPEKYTIFPTNQNPYM